VSLTSNDSITTSLSTRLLVSLNLETSSPDMVLGSPASTDSEPGRETGSASSFETLVTCEDLEESHCKIKANSTPYLQERQN